VTAPFFFIVNPGAGSGRAAASASELLAEARALGIAFEWDATQGRETATSLARQALRAGASTVVAVGGDGTLNEVLNGYFLDDELIRPDATLGMLPLGSSSDFARALGIPSGLAALRLLGNGRRLRVDIGRAAFGAGDGRPQVRYFANNADLGIGARIATLARNIKQLGGGPAFLLAAGAAVLDPQPWSGMLAFDGAPAEELSAVTVVVALGPYTGGGMHIAPGAKVDDGQFDVITIRAMGASELLRNLPRIYLGTHEQHPAVSRRRATAIAIHTEDTPGLELDGEVCGVGSVDCRILPASLAVWAPWP